MNEQTFGSSFSYSGLYFYDRIVILELKTDKDLDLDYGNVCMHHPPRLIFSLKGAINILTMMFVFHKGYYRL